MKKILLFLFGFILLIHQTAYANGAGLPTFFKINGKYTYPNPLQVYGITSQSFLLPQDYAPENYLVNQPISFVIDEPVLAGAFPPQIMQDTTFVWDYGDGSDKTSGLQNTHTYTKAGSYILVLTINITTDPSQQPTQFIDSYLLNILPNASYVLPKAVIKINGLKVGDASNVESDNVNFSHPVSFDATSSKSNAPIIQYLWGFGDGQTGTKSQLQHKYSSQGNEGNLNPNFDVVVLRVKDSNGFISDDFVGVNNDTSDSLPKAQSNENTSTTNNFFQGVFIPVVFCGGITLLYLFFIRKIRSNKSKDSIDNPLDSKK